MSAPGCSALASGFWVSLEGQAQQDWLHACLCVCLASCGGGVLPLEMRGGWSVAFSGVLSTAKAGAASGTRSLVGGELHTWGFPRWGQGLGSLWTPPTVHRCAHIQPTCTRGPVASAESGVPEPALASLLPMERAHIHCVVHGDSHQGIDG